MTCENSFAKLWSLSPLIHCGVVYLLLKVSYFGVFNSHKKQTKTIRLEVKVD